MTTFATSFSGLCAFAGVPENTNGQVPLVQVLFTHGGSVNMTPHEPFLIVPEQNVVSGCLPDFVLGSLPDAYAVWRLHGFRLRYPPRRWVDWAVKGLFNISTCHVTPGSKNKVVQRDALSAAGTIAGLVELCGGEVREGEQSKRRIRYKDLGEKDAPNPPEAKPPLSVVHTLDHDFLLLLELIPLNHAVGTGRLIAIIPDIVRDKDGNPVIENGELKTAPTVNLQISNYQHPEAQPTAWWQALHHFVAHYDLLESPPDVANRYFPVDEIFIQNRPTGANCFRGPLMAGLSGTVETVEHLHGHHVAPPMQALGGRKPSI